MAGLVGGPPPEVRQREPLRLLLREGFAADLAIFDPEEIAETNSFENPKSYPVGIPYVIVNGTLVIDGGEHTGARPGRVLRGRGYEARRAVSEQHRP